MLEAIIFDMDGVLIDSESTHYPVLHELLKEYGYHYTQEHFLKYCGVPETDMWPQLLCAAGLHADPAAMQQEHWRRYCQYLNENGIPDFPGTGQLLSALKQHGYRLAVASASPAGTIAEYMEQLGYAPYFDCMVSAQHCAHGKPWPDVFLSAAEQLGVSPQNCLVVEDSRNGMIAAQRAGMKWVGFCGAALPTDMSLAAFSFSDYREVVPENFEQWYDSLADAGNTQSK